MKKRNEFKTYYDFLIYKKTLLTRIKPQLEELGCGFFTIKQIDIEIENCHKEINDQVW